MVYTTQQCGFSAGELSPSLLGRTDLQKYRLGASTMRNLFVSYTGGASSRAGLAYCGTCLQSGSITTPPRDIPFQFNINQGYTLEFGDGTINHAVTGTGPGAANPHGGNYVRISVGTQRLFSGGTVTVSAILGTTEANGTWPINIIDITHLDLVGTTYVNPYVGGGYVSTFHYMRIVSGGGYLVEVTKTVTSVNSSGLFTSTLHGYNPGDWILDTGNTGFNGLTWIIATVPTVNTFTITDLYGNAVTSAVASTGGTIARVYNVASPYASADLPYLKFTQSADTMTLCCVNQITQTEYPSYELERNSPNATFIDGVWTFTQDVFTASITSPTNVAGVAQSSTTLSTWYSYVVTAINNADDSEGNPSSAVAIQNNDININAGSNIVSWSPVAGAANYNVYRATPSYNTPVPAGALYGFVGSTTGATFTDTNIVANFNIVPPVHTNPFAPSAIINIVPTAGGTGYTQANIGYTISTFTGSGFAGVPVVVNNQFTDFVIFNEGTGYAPSDTITITGGGSATGSISFASWTNLAQSNTITLNGVTWTFVAPPVAAPNQSLDISAAGSLAASLADFISRLNQSTTAALTVASYALSSATTGYILNITYKTGGVGGNGYSLATSIAGVTVSGATLTGGVASGGATATLTLGPSSGTYPSVPTYFQQRRGYANSLNEPDTYWLSKPGAFNNMDSSIPTIDSDAISGSPWAQQINGIQFMQPMPGGLVIFTGKQAWQLNGGNSAAITPADQTANPQASNGCSSLVPPIAINYDILYVQSKNSVVRDLQYNFFVNIYTGTDQTVLSNHLFTGHQIIQWAYAEEPYKIIWAVREDGVLLSFTYLKEQDVYGWARHDTNGLVKSVCTVTEPIQGGGYVDAIYCVVSRYVNGAWRYYQERMDNRQWENVEQVFAVDAGLSYPMNFPAATLQAASATGAGNIGSVNLTFGGTLYTSPIITATDPNLGSLGTGVTFSATVVSGVITAIAVLTPGTGYLPGTFLTIQDATGSGAVAFPVLANNVVFTASSGVFANTAGSGKAGDVIRVGGGKATVTTYSSSTSVTANITVPITATVPNDPNNLPAPAISGAWSVSTPTTTVSGLNHLNGLEVVALADGAEVLGLTVTNNSITLPYAASQINVGLAFTWQLGTMYLDAQDPAGGGSIQGRRKNVQNMVIRMTDTMQVSAGTNQSIASQNPNQAEIPWVNMYPIKFRTPAVPMGYPTPFFSGDEYINVSSGWETPGVVNMEGNSPNAATILSVYPNWNSGDANG